MPHFDYVLPLVPYCKSTVVRQLERLYNRAVKHCLNLNIGHMDLVGQLACLSSYRVLPFRGRCVFRLGIIAYNVLNGKYLSTIKNELALNHNERYDLRVCLSRPILVTATDHRKSRNLNLRWFITNFVNSGVRQNYKLNFVDYKNFLLDNLFFLCNIL